LVFNGLAQLGAVPHVGRASSARTVRARRRAIAHPGDSFEHPIINRAAARQPAPTGTEGLGPD